MTQDEIFEAAIKANAEEISVKHSDDEIGDWHNEYSFDAEKLNKFAELILASQAQPTPSQSVDSYSEYERNIALREANHAHDAGNYFKARPQIESSDRRKFFEAGYNMAWQAYPNEYNLTKPQPTSQEYCCTHSWRYAKNKAWDNRSFKLCKCDHNESCSHCYPCDFKDGGKWDLCKPEKANERE